MALFRVLRCPDFFAVLCQVDEISIKIHRAYINASISDSDSFTIYDVDSDLSFRVFPSKPLLPGSIDNLELKRV